jgi:pimeloyl-ACP methyl ester carboxylesterase
MTVVVALAYLGLCALLYFFQRSLIYFPQPRSPVAGTTMTTLRTDDADVLVTTRAASGAKALIYFGGNAEDASLSFPGLAAAYPDRAIYLMHYRGYGGSGGKPSESALVADAVALFDEVRARHEDILVVGRSLGSGVAVQLASLRPVARLVLVTPYDSVLELATRQFPYFPVRWLLRDRFESSKYAERITAPTLVIAADHDEVIPRSRTDALLARFPRGVATFRVIAGTGHNSISESPEYVPALRF